MSKVIRSLSLLCLSALALLACSPDPIEPKVVEQPITEAKVERRRGVRRFVHDAKGSSEYVATKPVDDASITGDLGAFQAFEAEPSMEFFVKLMETPSTTRSVYYLGTLDDVAYLKVVYAPQGEAIDRKRVSEDEEEESEEGEAKPEVKVVRERLEMVRIISMYIDRIGEERFEQALKRYRQIREGGGFPYQAGLPTAEESAFMARFSEAAKESED